MVRKRAKEFVFTLLKTLNPKYYLDLGEKELYNAIRYFLTLLLAAFLVMSVLAIPKAFFIKSDMDKASTDIVEFKFNSEFETAKPVSIPKNSPVITFDTTNNKSIDTELILITDEKIYYNLFGTEKETDMEGYDFTKNRKGAANVISLIFLFMLPSIFAFYYLSYLAKYLAIIIICSIISFIGARIMKNTISYKKSLALAFYTSTVMVLLEILSLPFFIKKYLITYSAVGISSSVIAITAFLTLYVTSIRINGNRDLKE